MYVWLLIINGNVYYSMRITLPNIGVTQDHRTLPRQIYVNLVNNDIFLLVDIKITHQ